MNNTPPLTTYALAIFAMAAISFFGWYTYTQRRILPFLEYFQPAKLQVRTPAAVESNLEIDNTGVEPSTPSAEGVTANQRLKLRTRLPLELSNFSVSYSYTDRIFIVELCPPYESSQAEFTGWLQQENLGEIPDREFEYRYQATCPPSESTP